MKFCTEAFYYIFRHVPILLEIGQQKQQRTFYIKNYMRFWAHLEHNSIYVYGWGRVSNRLRREKWNVHFILDVLPRKSSGYRCNWKYFIFTVRKQLLFSVGGAWWSAAMRFRKEELLVIRNLYKLISCNSGSYFSIPRRMTSCNASGKGFSDDTQG
jgi:hypothetical protein